MSVDGSGIPSPPERHWIRHFPIPHLAQTSISGRCQETRISLLLKADTETYAVQNVTCKSRRVKSRQLPTAVLASAQQYSEVYHNSELKLEQLNCCPYLIQKMGWEVGTAGEVPGLVWAQALLGIVREVLGVVWDQALLGGPRLGQQGPKGT